jgi:hypothetical protein
MQRRIELKGHLRTEELKRRYLACQKAQEKTRWRALYLISKGVIAAQAARRVGRTSGWVTQLVSRYNRQGPDAIPRQGGRGDVGRPPKLCRPRALPISAAHRRKSRPRSKKAWAERPDASGRAARRAS